MKISVITVCMNSARTIADTLRSFLAQTHPDKELVVIDGGSQDETVSIARSFAHPAIRIFSERDNGIYDAMNKGLAAYTGDAVGFLNSNDTFHDARALASIASALASAEAAYGDIVFVTDHCSKKIVRTWNAGHYRRGSFRSGWLPPHPTFYIRRELADRTGRFDLQYGSAADYDFMLRALELHASRVKYIPQFLVDFENGGQSSGSITGYIKANLLCLKSRQQHLRSPIVDVALIAKPLRKLNQFHWRA
ncbi:MAG TPA: glycosyltransferase family 2 protein [Micropepsaceae bacterium]|nr:glycosyltransferase family 2 protein [Micropepsaceae bacterium]